MRGDPARFEALGSRLGFRVTEDNAERLKLEWRGARFPAYLCFGIAVALLFLSIPIVQAIRIRGFVGPAGSLWYFPLMNLVLFGIGSFLVMLKRTIVFDHAARAVLLTKRTLFRTFHLNLSYDDVEKICLSIDQVYSGFGVAGSTAAESFPVPSLRLRTNEGETVLLDRGSKRRLESLGKQISDRLQKFFEVDEALRA